MGQRMNDEALRETPGKRRRKFEVTFKSKARSAADRQSQLDPAGRDTAVCGSGTPQWPSTNFAQPLRKRAVRG